MIKLIKVTGQSLSPEYREGDYVMIVTVPFFVFKPGNTVVFEHPAYGTLIKKILRLKAHQPGLWSHSAALLAARTLKRK